jgi:hypothetical protein
MNEETRKKIQKLYRSEYWEVDINNVPTLIDAGYLFVVSNRLVGIKPFLIYTLEEIKKYWDSYTISTIHTDWDAPRVQLGIFSSTALNVRDELAEALDDYIESCHRQGIEFNEKEAKRFCQDNEHMNLTEEEKAYIQRRKEGSK